MFFSIKKKKNEIKAHFGTGEIRIKSGEHKHMTPNEVI